MTKLQYSCVLQKEASKKSSRVAKKESTHFDHYNLINKKNQQSKFCMKVLCQVNFKILLLDLLNDA